MSTFSPQELIVEPAQNNALGMLNSSRIWLTTARHLIHTSNDKLHPGMEFSPAIYFLILQGLEGALKSFLCTRGVADTRLKSNFGHNIIKLIDEAELLGIKKHCAVNHEARERISLIARNYAEKDLQYFMGDAIFRWPLPDELLQDVSHTQKAIEDEFRSHLQN